MHHGRRTLSLHGTHENIQQRSQTVLEPVHDENLWNTSIIIPLSNTLTSHSFGISDNEVSDDVIAPEIESEPRYNLRS